MTSQNTKRINIYGMSVVLIDFLKLYATFFSPQLNGIQQAKLDKEGIPHIQGQLNDDLYAVPVKRASPSPAVDTPDKDRLPPGWEKHEGIYIHLV